MKPDTFRKLSALGLTNEQIAGVLEVIEEVTSPLVEKDEDRRAKGLARWHKWKANNPTNVSKRLPTLANDSRGDARVEDITSNLEISGKIENKEENARDARLPVSGFSEFWELFPNKVGKRDAEKAFAAALRRAPFEAIMAGLRRYVAKTDDRPWCNPATFLNQNRWEDQPAAQVATRSQAPPRRDTYVDAMNRILEGRANGTENLFGTDGDAQRLPADGKRQGIDVADVRGGLARRFIPGSH